MGFEIRETMMGTHEFVEGRGPSGQRRFGFRIAWGPRRLLDWLNPTSERFLWQELAGEVLADGLCDWTPCRGTLELQYFGRRRIRYTFDFEVAGTTYRFLGEKADIRPWNLAVSHTTCHGNLTELATGKLISTAVVTFKMRHLPSFLGSLRWKS